MTKRAQSKLWRLQTWTDGTRRSYPEPVNPPVTTIYRVENNEVGYCLQGYPLNDNGVGPSATYRAIAAKADWVMLGAMAPSDVASETTLVGQFRSLRSGCKMIRYTDPRYWYDNAGPGNNSPFIETYQIINTNSAPAIWTTKNAAGATLAHTWSPSDTNGINWAVVTGATNSLGQTLQQAARYQWQQNVPWALYDGVFLDDMNTIANQLAIRNTTTEINYSYLQDGIDYDFRTNYTFGNAWRSGIAALVNEFRGISNQFLAMTNTADIGYWYLKYRFPFGFSSGGRPPTPFSSTAYSDLVDIGFVEVSFPQYGFGGYSGQNGSGYPISGYFSLANFYLSHELERQHCRTVITNRMGAQLVFHDAKVFSSNTATETQTDYSYVRACWAMTKLVEGGAYGVCRTTRQPFFLDETCIKLGAVVGGPRSMGTLNQPDVSTNDPASFTLRTPNQTNGSAQFYWAEFENALVVFRGDITGLTPGSSFFGDGTTVSYTLPSAGAGKKWQRPNCNTYVNPDFADLAMVAQSPSFNNGADATTSSLLPLHGEVFLRVSTAPPPSPSWEPNYPVIGGVLVQGSVFANPANYAKFAPLSYVVVQFFPESESNHGPLANACQQIQSLTPAGVGATPIHTVYSIHQEAYGDTGQETGFYADVIKKLNDENWWLRTTYPSGSVVPAEYSGNWEINNTGYAHDNDKDANGKSWLVWHAEYIHKLCVTGGQFPFPNGTTYTISANPFYGAHMLDNIFWTKRVNGDYNQDGVSEVSSDLAYRASVQRGYKIHADRLRELSNTVKVFGNMDMFGSMGTDVYLENYTPNYSAIGDLHLLMDGGLACEYWLSDSREPFSLEWQNRNNGLVGFWCLRNIAKYMHGTVRNPRMCSYAAHDLFFDGTPADEQRLRFGMATVYVLTNGMFDDRGAISGNSATHPYYTNNGAGHGWLGQPISSTPSWTPYQNGVYLREFTNGFVAVNPRNNGSRSITLGVSVRNIATGVTYITGQSIPIADRDGLLLVKI